MKHEWIAIDRGATQLRCWLMDGSTVKEGKSAGISTEDLSAEGTTTALLDLVSPWLSDSATPRVAVACGMGGEGQRHAVPCPPPAAQPATVPFARDGRLKLFVLPGLRQNVPAGVMSGEETQIAGFLTLNPGFDGVLVLTGRHSNWAQISAGEIVSFRTFMTGELTAAIGTATVLRHSIGTSGWDEEAFSRAAQDTLSRPEQLAARLFELRAETLLHDLPPDAGGSRLAGLLIGAELAAARPYWLGTEVAVIGSGRLARPYLAALRGQGLCPTAADGGAMTRAGLTAAWRQLRKNA